MFGNNPIRPRIDNDGTVLAAQEIFSTFQGEGLYAGHPAVFIRLGGCNLSCNFCDTEFESYNLLKLDTIIKKVNKLSGLQNKKKHPRKLIVLTGGEPFRQPIEKLCQSLVDIGYKVQIETNGTLYRNLAKEVEITCSPKNTGNGYKPIRKDLITRINAIKFIISKSNKLYNNIAEIGQTEHNIPVYLQPMDEYDTQKNANNMALTLKLANQYNYRISLQTHKLLGIK